MTTVGGAPESGPPALRGAVSPQLARAIDATHKLWESVETEYGMLTAVEVDRLIGSRRSLGGNASAQRAAGKLIGIKRGNRVLYPGFQFELAAREVLAVIPELLQMAKEVGWDEQDLVFWLVSPSGYFHGDRPVDHLDEAGLVDKGRRKATVEW